MVDLDSISDIRERLLHTHPDEIESLTLVEAANEIERLRTVIKTAMSEMEEAYLVLGDYIPVESGHAAAIEVEITPQMVEAGYRVLCNSGIADEYLEADRTLVVQIYDAMTQARHIALF